MTEARRTRWERTNFAQLEDTTETLRADFDIDLLKGLDAGDRTHAILMFHRRHLHAHKGGIADQKYLDESHDMGIEVGQLVRETHEGVHRLLSIVTRIANNLRRGFHSIIPVNEEPIAYHRKKATSAPAKAK
jgi:hypothetical protein